MPDASYQSYNRVASDKASDPKSFLEQELCYE